VEPSTEEPGVFWLNAAGLDRLYASLDEWARLIVAELERAGFRATVVVGFTRFGSYALAKARQGTLVIKNSSQELEVAQKVPLTRLHLDPNFRDTLLKLGVKTVGALLSLPAEGLRERFGAEAYRLYRMAAGDLWAPLQPYPVEEPIRQSLALDDPESDVMRLLFLVKQLLHPVLAKLVAREEALAELSIRLLLYRTDWREEHIRPATPTVNVTQLMDLVRLRLESMMLPAGVIQIELTARGTPATREQLRFFVEQPRRDLTAANRALARLRAEFGEAAVVRARLLDEYLPEASFAWEPIDEVALPQARQAAFRTMVRRIFFKPAMLPSQPRHTHDDGWLLLGVEHGPVTKMHGPYVLSGGWWREETHRDYYFAETKRGDLLWIYHDRHRRHWFLHGKVE
jgi:protein ImuB